MLLTVTTTHVPATDLGYLLGKHPERVQTFSLAHGEVHVFYPEATRERCTAALLLDVDPVGLVRGRGKGDPTALDEYVNDRPYAASSFLAVALGRTFRDALAGSCKERPELATTALPLELTVVGVRCRGGEAFVRQLFEPLGYEVSVERLALDAQFPEWGESRTFILTLRTTARLADALSHLSVLIPVLDDDKHYWVGEDEVKKLLDRGGAWLAGHPARSEIAMRYLKHRRALQRLALDRLVQEEAIPLEVAAEEAQEVESRVERKLSLNETRIEAVVRALTSRGATSVVDLGCGEGRLLRRLLAVPTLARIVGVDASPRALEIAARRLRLDDAPEKVKSRLSLWNGALTYRDARFAGFDAATLVEVIEHVDPGRLPAVEAVVFEHARPRLVVVTTPNVEHNVKFEGLRPGRLRHADHRFEWTRSELAAWAERVAATFGYDVSLEPIGEDDAVVGPPTQMAVFTRRAT